MELSGWVASLASLRWLSVAAPHIMVNWDVGQLRLLRTLQVSALSRSLQRLACSAICSDAVHRRFATCIVP